MGAPSEDTGDAAGTDRAVSAEGTTGRGPRRRGRRAGGQDTRGPLLDAARAVFAERGYDGATVRLIAERAGVDPAMVNHWFGGKDALFTASLEMPLDPARIRAEVLPGDPGLVGERIVRRFLAVWDGAGQDPMVTLLRSVTTHPTAARMMREFVTRVLIGPLVASVAPDRHRERGALVGSQLIGLGLMRYVVRLEPLASAGHDEIAAAVAPTVQRYLTGDLDGVPGGQSGTGLRGSMNPDS